MNRHIVVSLVSVLALTSLQATTDMKDLPLAKTYPVDSAKKVVKVSTKKPSVEIVKVKRAKNSTLEDRLLEWKYISMTYEKDFEHPIILEEYGQRIQIAFYGNGEDKGFEESESV